MKKKKKKREGKTVYYIFRLLSQVKGKSYPIREKFTRIQLEN